MKNMILITTLALSAVAYGAEPSTLDSKDPVERAQAAQRIGREKDAAGVEALFRLMKDTETNVAYAAAQALAEIGNEKAAECLADAMKAGLDGVADDAALVCARARCSAKDEARRNALLEACYASKNLRVKAAALSLFARIDPKKYAQAFEGALLSEETVLRAAAAQALQASSELVPVAVRAAGEAKDVAKASLIAALASHAAQASVKPVLLAALSDESELVRLAALRATVKANDPEAFPLTFAACSKGGEEERVARLMVASCSAKGLDDYLYEQLKQPASREKAVDLLASRHHPALISRLCDASLYTEKGVNQAAAGAFRLCLQDKEIAKAMTFVFTDLPADQRAPFVSALAAVLQQVQQAEGAVPQLSILIKSMKPEDRMQAVDLLAALQTPSVCALLLEQAKTDQVDYRKAIVRTLGKWNLPDALDALVALAKDDGDRSIRILAIRNALTLLDKKELVSPEKRAAVLKALVPCAEREEEKKLIYDALKKTDKDSQEPSRQKIDAQA